MEGTVAIPRGCPALGDQTGSRKNAGDGPPRDRKNLLSGPSGYRDRDAKFLIGPMLVAEYARQRIAMF
jgi:hypothetical protein